MGRHRFRTRKPLDETVDRPDQQKNRRCLPENQERLPDASGGRGHHPGSETTEKRNWQQSLGVSLTHRRSISPDSVLHILHRVLRRAGLPRVRFHDLRHTFAPLALQNGVDIKTISGMLGHFSVGFTLHTYAPVTTAAQKEAARTMEKVLTAAI